MRGWQSGLGALAAGALLAASCGLPVDERNAFLTQAETFGSSLQTSDDDGSDGGDGPTPTEFFRDSMTVTLAANDTSGDPVLEGAQVEVLLAAWVYPSSLRDASQLDALIRDGYVQISQSLELGDAFTLPPGTLVYAREGAGIAGATRVALLFGDTRTFTFLTPDVILLFDDPPVGCDSVAYTYTRDGVPLESLPNPEGNGIVDPIFAGATEIRGGRKTYAQFNVYQCDPFQPGLFLGSGAGGANQYFEGQAVRVDFNTVPDAAGDFAIVTFE